MVKEERITEGTKKKKTMLKYSLKAATVQAAFLTCSALCSILEITEENPCTSRLSMDL